MNIIEFLKKGCRLKLEMESKKEVLDEVKANLDGLQAIKLSEKVQGGQIPSDANMVNRLSRVMEMEKELAELFDVQVELSRNIDKIKDYKEKSVLRYRYILDLSWKQIADRTGYSLPQVYNYHKSGLTKLKKIVNYSKIE